VIEGVETASDSRHARAAGICWQQGFYFGVPSFTAGRATTPHVVASGQVDRSGAAPLPSADAVLERLLLRWDKGALTGGSVSGVASSVALDGDTGIAISTLAPPLLVERTPSRAGVWL
jgi:hypothetical protein